MVESDISIMLTGRTVSCKTEAVKFLSRRSSFIRRSIDLSLKKASRASVVITRISYKREQ